MLHTCTGSTTEIAYVGGASDESHTTGAGVAKGATETEAAIIQTDTLYRGSLERPTSDTLPTSSTTTSTAAYTGDRPLKPVTAFQIINLRYDLSPMKNISAIITETGRIPNTSIPVLIKEFQSDQNNTNNTNTSNVKF